MLKEELAFPKFYLRMRKGKVRGLLAENGKNGCWGDNQWSGNCNACILIKLNMIA